MKKLLCFLVIAAIVVPVFARKVIGINFDEDYTVDGKKLVLNGVGLRMAEIALGFKVNVYAGGLYLEKLSSDAQAIIASPQTKLVRMIYAHSVDKEKSRKTWQENFEKNCAKCDSLKPILETFKGMLEDMDEDQVQDFLFVGTKIKLTSKKKPKGEIDSADFQKFLLSIWLDHAPNPELKDGMLGKAAK